MICLWCDKELSEDVESGNLCPDCGQVSTGVPGLVSEHLDHLPFGVIHLNRSGNVIAFNQAEERFSGFPSVDVVGRNFFTEVAPCAGVKEFRGRFDEFLDGDDLSERFNFAYYFGKRAVDVQITFLRVNRQLAFVLSKRMVR